MSLIVAWSNKEFSKIQQEMMRYRSPRFLRAQQHRDLAELAVLVLENVSEYIQKKLMSNSRKSQPLRF